MTIDFIIVAMIVLCLGGASFYIYRAKRSGKKCIGCPYASSCGNKASCNCGSAMSSDNCHSGKQKIK